MISSGWRFAIFVCVFFLIILGAYAWGRHHSEPKITWYSDMTNQLQGHKIYLIDTAVSCPNRVGPGQQMTPGRQIGQLQIDINLYNGKLKVVKNTVPAVISCP